MPQDNTITSMPTTPISEPSNEPVAGAVATQPVETTNQPSPVAPSRNVTEVHAEVINRISESKNVLIALSSDPSVDEMAAAIGLSLYLDRLGKRATAIYSGTTPNALEFLKPEDTFESSADTLQDFVIAINKDKADHLRYKLDGEYVKVYITPYRTRVSESDLEFSYGDYNVDLVLALDVNNGIDLDSALREHGRIMHDAVIVNITTGSPGKFGEIEWSDKSASSVSEMIATLLYEGGAEQPINKDEATAFLTGIVAATNRFSNAKTTSVTMQISSQLMESGANQQLVAKNITPDVENEMATRDTSPKAKSSSGLQSDDTPATIKTDQATEQADDDSHLEITHDQSSDESEAKEEDDKKNDEPTVDAPSEPTSESPSDIDATTPADGDQGLLDDLKAAEESLSHAGAEAVPTVDHTTLKIDGTNATVSPQNVDLAADTNPLPVEPTMPEPVLPAPIDSSTSPSDQGTIDKPETIITPTVDANPQANFEEAEKYGKMLEDALSSAPSSVEPSQPIMSTPDDGSNPATLSTPDVPSAPEINGVPEMNFMPDPNDTILPPPPTPPIGMPLNTNQPMTPIEPAMPVVPPEPTPLGDQPAMQDQVYSAQANDPSAFKIPGM